MSCIACGRFLHEECEKPIDDAQCCCKPTQTGIAFSDPESNVGRPLKPDDEIGVSAGRKRAATAYQIISEKPCEWIWKANCGGGLFPIIGCMNGTQQHRHHGPVKNTARNEPTNVHLICARCHNTWHAKNDSKYNEDEYDKLPHKPRPATPEELLSSS